ncbi:MAG TPA: type II CAAX endopeptidase family protein [Candidatus Saccharimonadales bacterium]|nr:type II CAAX endopeptidase family protein [Candidatus Saccharimonadales bacterium]
MKSCPYCGAEYPDDVTVCPVDQQPLPQATGANQVREIVATEAAPPQSQSELSGKISSDMAWPEYRWSPKAALKCIGTIILLDFIVSFILGGFEHRSSSFREWRFGGFGFFSGSLLYYIVELIAVIYFARTDTFASFCKAVGLDRKPTNLVWFGVVAALAIRMVGHFVLIHGWSNGVRDYDILSFKSTFGPERYFFLGPLLLLAPLFEESMYRGFLYRAFRGSWSLGISMVMIVAWIAWTHWSQYSVSWIAALDLSMLTILQCYLREKSDSLWDCIFCHMAFNATLIFIGFH